MSKGLVIDANLLLLLIIGQLDGGRFIKSSMRLNAYTENDYKLVSELISLYPCVYITPYIATEISNLIDLKREQRFRAYEMASIFLNECSEIKVSAKQDSKLSAFITHGITDASLVELVKEFHVLTNDHRLLPMLYSAAPDNVIPFGALSYLLNSAEIKK